MTYTVLRWMMEDECFNKEQCFDDNVMGGTVKMSMSMTMPDGNTMILST